MSLRFEDDTLKTEFLSDEIEKCEDIDELKLKVYPLWIDQKDRWASKFNRMLEECGMTKSDFAKASGISRVSVNKWAKGAIPKNRETFLRIGITAGYDVEQMNQLLKRYGRYPELYPKSLEDCVCIYVLQNYTGKDAVSKYEEILSKMEERILDNMMEEEEYSRDLLTRGFFNDLSSVTTEDELESFVTENSPVFQRAYQKFYVYVIRMIKDNYLFGNEKIYDLVAAQNWSSSLRQCVYSIFQKKWYPTRNKIISLGIHLSMDRSQVNKMLELAHMEPLCAKNLFEGVIIYILENASLNELIGDEANRYEPDELYGYVREVLTELNIPEVEFFMSEFPEEDDNDRW